MKAALVRRETFLLHRDDFVEDRFGKIIASFLSVPSGESVIHLFCFECFPVTITYRLSLENKLGFTYLTSRQSETGEMNPTFPQHSTRSVQHKTSFCPRRLNCCYPSFLQDTSM